MNHGGIRNPLHNRKGAGRKLSTYRCARRISTRLPSIARFGRQAYPGRGEVTTHERLGRTNHGCHAAYAVAVGATGVVSTPAGLNIKK